MEKYIVRSGRKEERKEGNYIDYKNKKPRKIN